MDFQLEFQVKTWTKSRDFQYLSNFSKIFANVSWFQAYLKVFVIHPIGEMKPPGLPVTLQPQVMYDNEGNDSDYTVYIYIYIYQMVK